jgi:mono/diheme cytochrome c family protein
MMRIGRRARFTTTLAMGFALIAGIARGSPTCPDEQATPQVPTPEAIERICKPLSADVRTPSRFRLDDYERKLKAYLDAMCHRDEQDGWVRDKRVRDAGPWVGTYSDGGWTGKYFGTHVPVLIWYSKEMVDWLKTNRPTPESVATKPVPDGAIMIKEMYPPPAAACAAIDPPTKLKAFTSASAVMVRDSKGSYDGWFWGWYGWGPKEQSKWNIDWPAEPQSPYPRMGFGQYCVNCHASAQDNATFSALKNLNGQKGEPLVFLSQNFFLDPSWKSLQTRIQEAGEKDKAAIDKDPDYNEAFTRVFASLGGLPQRRDFDAMPSGTYDSVWSHPGEPTAAGQFTTSDQCLGCHSAGGTGLQYDMTQPGPGDKLINISPYGTWRGSPMGLSGRDPIFFAQLASETGKFHQSSKETIENTCLGCHGIMGQRQHGIDSYDPTSKTCKPFARSTLQATPMDPKTDPVSALAHYGALARDGISCASCHQMVLGREDTDKYRGEPQNACIPAQQGAANPGFTDFAATFTGNFFVGPPNDLYGPFQEPKKKPMKQAIGRDPVHSQTITRSEMCGSCHTVHVPILHDGNTIGRVYEQTTYPEWAFSDFRTGDSPDGTLPYGPGAQAQSCQSCHMPNKDAGGKPYRSKIAAIQEYSNYPQAEHTLPPADIDLPERAGFGQHTLVGLNVYLLKMAWQFPDVLGIRKTDPMLSDSGIGSIPTAEGAMIDQAVNRTAVVSVGEVRRDDKTLGARVTVINKVGHKFPSGVGFRRAFVQFSVLDVNGKELWSSGRTDGAGVILDENNAPIEGELWWTPNCSARISPFARLHQPHYQEITQQNQAQIYQELVSAPAATTPTCGHSAKPQGELTTSFLSICAKVKDNRILPQGFLKLPERVEIAKKLGADEEMAYDAGPDEETAKDPDYGSGGRDSLTYRVALSELPPGAKPVAVQATLYYQPTPPFYLQDRFCTSESKDTKLLYYVAGKLNLAGTAAQDWKLRVVTSGPVGIP